MSQPTCQAHIATAETHITALLLAQADPALTRRVLSGATVGAWVRQMYADAERQDAAATLASARGWYAAVKAAITRETAPAQDNEDMEHPPPCPPEVWTEEI